MTTIVVGIDGSEGARRALVWAAREAELRNANLTALLAWGFLDQHHARDGVTFDPEYSERDARVALAAYLQAADARSRAIEARVVCDLPGRALLDAAVDAELLVVGARGLGGLKGVLLGSVSQYCLHHTPCPVVVVRGEDDGGQDRPGEGQHIVVAVDGSETALLALQWAIDEARRRDASLDVVHAWHLPYVVASPYMVPAFDTDAFDASAGAVLDGALARVDVSGLTSPVSRRVLQGGAAEAILRAAKGADLVVMGSRGLGGFKGMLLGSVSNHVAHHADCPVVVVPPGRDGETSS